MGSRWIKLKLKDIATFQEGYVNPSQDKSEYFDGPVKWLRAVDLNNGFVKNTSRTLSEAGFNSAGKSAYLFEPGTLAISKSGTIGRLGILQDYMCGNRAVINIKVDGNKCNILYVYYFLLLNRSYIENLATGSVQKNLYTSILGDVDLLLPPLEIQDKIVGNLICIDKKIEINRQINQTLEQMAQTLFKSWFVDFDPVIDNALDAGNEIPESLQNRAELRQKVRASQDFQPLPADVRALFPAEFEESELGWVPKGWEVDSLNSVASYTSDRVDISELNLNNYISTENMLSDRQGVCSASSLPTVQTVPSYSTGHILISNIRPYFKKIWFAHGTGGRSSDVLGFSANQAGTEDYLYNLLYQDVFFDFMMTTSKGSKMPRGDKDAIMDWPLVIPSMELRRFYSLKCKASRSFGEMHRNENRTLEQLRDTLLPKLISGELRLDDLPDEVVTAANE